MMWLTVIMSFMSINGVNQLSLFFFTNMSNELIAIKTNFDIF